MTTNQLHDILDNPKRKLTKSELSAILYELRCDCFNADEYIDTDKWTKGFYAGELNAFYICSDLLSHLDEKKLLREVIEYIDNELKALSIEYHNARQTQNALVCEVVYNKIIRKVEKLCKESEDTQ